MITRAMQSVEMSYSVTGFAVAGLKALILWSLSAPFLCPALFPSDAVGEKKVKMIIYMQLRVVFASNERAYSREFWFINHFIKLG